MHPFIRAALIYAGLLALFAAPAAASDDQRRAVEAALANAPECRGLGNAYWEIGDVDRPLASGQVGRMITATRPIRIASASKWVFGAYVLEKTGGKPTATQIDALEMKSGYDNFDNFACVGAATIDACLAHGSGGKRNPAHVGMFSYNGGHDEQLAHDLGIGTLDVAALSRDLADALGPGIDIEYVGPQPAGGMRAAPAAYGAFLRKILGGKLQMSQWLGAHPVCTLPSRCPEAASSPSPYPWHYSLNHWVEDAPGQDGAFSSPGMFGFYPWIAADRQSYGILARVSLEPGAYLRSARCGAAMRAAWAKAGTSQ